MSRNLKPAAATLSLTALAALIFFVAAAVPYFLSTTYGPPGYASRRGWLLLHIGGGAVALLSGPVQLWLGVADRAPAWHRRLGFTYLAAIAASATAAFYMAAHTDGGWVFGAGLTGLAVAWITTTSLAFVAIRRHLIDQHREWMIRSYVVTFGFVFFRMVFPLLQARQIGTMTEQLAAAAWGCWSIPLLVTELVLQGRKILRLPTMAHAAGVTADASRLNV